MPHSSDLGPLKLACAKLGISWNAEEESMLSEQITHRKKEDMNLYNYNDKPVLPRNHPVVSVCRGIVVTDEGNIVNFPFTRFFNHWQEECKPIDWNSSVVIEKLDGTMISVFHHNGKWEVTTRGSFYPDGTPVDFGNLFKKHFSAFSKLAQGYTYIFELCTFENRVVTKYTREAVYLIGVRELNGYTEMNQGSLNILAADLGVLRPNMYPVHNIKDVIDNVFNYQSNDFEGVVVVDSSFNRMKVKKQSYLEMAKLSKISDQELFDHILGCSTTAIDLNLLSDLPDRMDSLSAITRKWACIVSFLCDECTKYKDMAMGDRKVFAELVKELPYKGCLFSIYDGKGTTFRRLKWEDVLNWNI